MAQKGFIDIGQRFRPTGDGPFGRPQAIWRVINSFEGTDGMAYAHLISEADPSASKTVSIAALMDKRLYRPEGA